MLEQVVKTRALVVEDDPNIVDLIRSNLAVRGFDTVVSTDGLRALNLLETEAPDIVLLDLMLPAVDGFELCRLIRERSPVAIIVVSARGGERDKVAALNVGADDYMTKPFSIEELLARITATLRRTRPADAAPESAPPVITIGEVEIDLAGQQVTRGGRAVHLTPTEFALLRELAINRGKLLTHAHLLRRVWGRGYETETEYVRVYIRRLRAKLEPDGGVPLILTQPRAGVPDRRGVRPRRHRARSSGPGQGRWPGPMPLIDYLRSNGDVNGPLIRMGLVFCLIVLAPRRPSRGPVLGCPRHNVSHPRARWFLCTQ